MWAVSKLSFWGFAEVQCRQWEVEKFWSKTLLLLSWSGQQERTMSSSTFFFTYPAKLSRLPLFHVSAFALCSPPIFISLLPSFHSKDALWNMALAQWPIVEPACWNVLQIGANTAKSRTEVDLPGFISLFCVVLSISSVPQLPESSQFLMGRHQWARVAPWIRGSWNSATPKTVFKSNLAGRFSPF